MAFSPPPPTTSSLPNPRKRPSISSTVSAAAAKRAKLHPLRQTSFPAAHLNSSAIDTSRSAVSARSETGSAFSGTSSRLPGGGSSVRGRGRPKKDKGRIPSREPEGTASQTGGAGRPRPTGRGRTAKSVISAPAGEDGDDEPNEDEDDSDEEGSDEENALALADEFEADKLLQQRERRLASTLTGDAEQRYEAFRGMRLEKKTVRRIVNAVMSQSANEKVVLSIGFTGKLFLGGIVEGARVVQQEFAQAYDETREVEKAWRVEELARLKAVIEREKEEGAVRMDDKDRVLVTRDIARLEREVKEYIPNPHRGGLLPDHLREALRRYRATGEGFSAGDQGSAHALLGVPGGCVRRLGGRRLFR
ncbi:uncharacterized protein AB675_5527 [Cyphellophora attinorum]|uniref:TAFII28-like protein domain-containing protein n=1 Tax=Cyphellophora attinorum TaxID=1664694 RepID=A0A0N0NNX4_9EURO|nr:uncharacterized protein AB675_5527 [Phialophora attinorum]KPI42058.1 hypothetical protein AB675_5527 [Phialophora attinorum]